MSQKHLKELLKEEQEPFHLKDYISHKQCQLKKPKPISKSSPFSLKKSSVSKPPILQVPAKTASLLLEAALRIQNPKTQKKNSGLGLLGSMLKRLTNRSHNKLKNNETEDEKLTPPSSPSCSCSCSSSGSSIEEEEEKGFEFANVVRETGDYYGLCLSPISPFRFAPHPSPAAKSSPHRIFQESAENVQGSPVKLQEEEDEEDKEQNSPVSVLDPPFDEDDYDSHEDQGYSGECSYAFVQKEKQHLLHKLHKFDRMADLDPIELEKRMIEEEDEEVTAMEEARDYEEYRYEWSLTLDEQRQVDEFIEDIITKTGFQDIHKPGIKRLISDIVIEDSSDNGFESDEQVIKRVCKRLDSYKQVESNTIDMMVEIDLRGEIQEWKNPYQQIGETARDVELAIFSVLVEEFLEDIFP